MPGTAQYVSPGTILMKNVKTTSNFEPWIKASSDFKHLLWSPLEIRIHFSISPTSLPYSPKSEFGVQVGVDSKRLTLKHLWIDYRNPAARPGHSFLRHLGIRSGDLSAAHRKTLLSWRIGIPDFQANTKAALQIPGRVPGRRERFGRENPSPATHRTTWCGGKRRQWSGHDTLVLRGNWLG